MYIELYVAGALILLLIGGAAGWRMCQSTYTKYVGQLKIENAKATKVTTDTKELVEYFRAHWGDSNFRDLINFLKYFEGLSADAGGNLYNLLDNPIEYAERKIGWLQRDLEKYKGQAEQSWQELRALQEKLKASEEARLECEKRLERVTEALNS